MRESHALHHDHAKAPSPLRSAGALHNIGHGSLLILQFRNTLYFKPDSCHITPALFRRLLLPLFLAARLAAAEPLLDTVAKVHALRPAEAALGLPAHIKGIVTFCDLQGNLFVQDATGGIYVSSGVVEEQALRIQPGDRLEIEGKTCYRGFSNDVDLTSVRRVGTGPRPEPLRPGEYELLSPALDCQWVEISAMVTGVESVEITGHPFTLSLDVHGLKMEAVLPHDKNAARRAMALIQRPVQLRGIVSTIYNVHKQMTGRYFAVQSFDDIIPADAATPSVLAPVRKATELLRIEDTALTLVRVSGVVTQGAQNGFYLRDQSGGLLVQTSEKGPFPPGARVEAEGFAAIAPFRPILRARHVAILGETEKSIPHPLDPGKINSNEDFFDFQADLVTVKADFLARRDSLDGMVLQCRTGDYYFEAMLPNPGTEAKKLTIGDHVRLTGICELTTTHPRSTNIPDGFRLHLPSEGGIDILGHAPWLTLKHLLIVIGIISLVAFIAIIWVVLLHYRVNTQTKIIGAQLQKVAVQDERQRIARDLHDTVEQELTGLSMELGCVSVKISCGIADILPGPAAEMVGQAQKNLDYAQKLLRHCRQEARASIHNLRCIELEQRGLPGALRELLPPVAWNCGAKFELHLAGEPQPIDVTAENHLLRIAQEAVTNAAHHAAPDEITVSLDYKPSALTLEIRDNGCGFNPDTPAPEGHFGLQGIHERANKIQAEFDIQSAPGEGTNIRVVVPIKKN
jgi:signal transduction histidine kinase